MARADTILIVEDDDVARDAMAELLRFEGYEVTTCASGAEAVAACEREPPDIIISDLRMPGGDGLELVARVRARPWSSYIPIIMVSALDDHERRAAALDLGADDFVGKPVSPDELVARVRVQLRRNHRERALERRAVVDPLTGVLNRRGLVAVLHREQERSRRTSTPLSLLMIDVDRFKALNDELGHQAGDTALRQIAAAVLRSVRVVDHVGRLGGDEFVVVLPGGDAEAAATLASRLRGLRSAPVTAPDGTAREVTISVGAATLKDGETIDQLLERADQQMYRAKRTSDTPPLR